MTSLPPVSATNLVALFESSARAHNTRVAVRSDEHALTYRQLDDQSGAVAAELAARGIGRGKRVAVYLPRDVLVFAAVLGILKAGAAYVAIDTRLPAARRDLMVANSGASAVLTDSTFGPQLPPDIEIIEWDGRRQPTGPVPRVPVLGTDLACVMFTSGSTGAPKAIMIEHGNLVALAFNPSLPALTADDAFGQVASLSFDLFHVEMWCTLAVGGQVVVLPSMPELVNGDINRELRRRRITVLMPPTMAMNHIVHEDRKAFSGLRVLLTGGDVLEPAAVMALLDGGFDGELHNLYGPTEATSASTSHRVRRSDCERASIPIGTALHGEQCHVLDPDLRAVPPGEVGELVIGGAGITRGYRGAPARTADTFVPDPFGGAGARMYRTGDRARVREDGALEFLGRFDFQVKIRGYRVEPREVECAITRYPGVQASAVVVTGQDHDRRLVALVMGDGISPSALRDSLAQVLPDYLVPSAIVAVSAIPENANGKRDSDQLRAIAETEMRRQSRRIEPVDDVERYLVTLWEQLLRVEWIGRHDDFFALGGNSLLAFRARRQIARDRGVMVSVPDILGTSGLSELADRIRSLKTETAPSHPALDVVR